MHVVQLSGHQAPTYTSARSLEEAVDLLAEHGSRARIIAGGTDLMIELDRRITVDVDVLIDISRIEGLDGIDWAGDRIHLGPLVTHNQCATSELIVERALPLAQASLEVGSPALRNRATVVGNVATASPANDTISALVALDAEISLASSRGVRRMPLADFFTGVRRTLRADDELVTGLTIPVVDEESRGVFLKLGLRRAQAISVVHLAVVCRFDGDDVADVRIALGSVAPTIVRATEAEALLVGNPLTDAAIEAAAAAAARSVTPIDDLRSSADYRSDQIEVMTSRALRALRNPLSAVAPPDMVPTLGGPLVVADGAAATLVEGDTNECRVNGAEVRAPWAPGSLLHWLRDDVGLTGTKEGCSEGECGACTVHLDGTAVLSCLVPAGRAEGSTITTIEGLADQDGLHPLQRSFIENAAVQCGYCIPGFLMAGAALTADGAAPDVKLGLSGNLCRCTGYYPIETAVRVGDGP